MKLMSKQKQIRLSIISLICIITSFVAEILYKGKMLIYIEYISIGIALIMLVSIIVNKVIAEKN